MRMRRKISDGPRIKNQMKEKIRDNKKRALRTKVKNGDYEEEKNVQTIVRIANGKEN